MPPRVLVLRTAGTNCDLETARAVELAGGAAERLHVRTLLDGGRRLDAFGGLFIPGGFSYGDDLGAGTVLGNQLGTKLGDDLRDFIRRGRPVVGICNGFQVLVRLGILPGTGPGGERLATLMENESGRFEDRWVRLRVETSICPFLEKGRILEMPVAHKEGRFIAKDGPTLEALEHGGQVAFRYLETDSDAPAQAFPANPNGSMAAIAGVVNSQGNVVGLMPHPERFVRALQHPAWTRRAAGKGLPADAERSGDGFPFFAALMRHIACA